MGLALSSFLYFCWVKSIMVTPSPFIGLYISTLLLSTWTPDPKHPDAIELTSPFWLSQSPWIKFASFEP